MAGLFFCLASAEGAGLLFCPAAIQPHTSGYNGFYPVHAVIQHTPQNGAQGFTGAFPAICRVLPLPCGGCIQLYRTACATLDAVQASTAAYYNKVYKGAAYNRPCQPGGGLDTSQARRLAVWHRVDPVPSTRRGSPAAGARRAAQNH